MTFKTTWELTFDSTEYELAHGDNWDRAMKESADEFIADAQRFFDAHPFIATCRMINAKRPGATASGPAGIGYGGGL